MSVEFKHEFTGVRMFKIRLLLIVGIIFAVVLSGCLMGPTPPDLDGLDDPPPAATFGEAGGGMDKRT
ncbi:MAG TPA: hypothetical protein VGB30_06965 [bacterium]|jgi:hypothetical protein